MRKSYYIIPVFLFLITSCGNFTFKEVKEFTISDGILEDGEKEKIIYSSGAPDLNPDLDYYMHLIVVGQTNNDTVNLLSTGDALVTETDNMRYYIDNSSSANLIMQNLDKIQSGVNINDLWNKNIDKVVVNRTSSEDAANNYPTIIGGLANDVHEMTDEERARM